eukprot:7377321-Prymnesium_polylepis.2
MRRNSENSTRENDSGAGRAGRRWALILALFGTRTPRGVIRSDLVGLSSNLALCDRGRAVLLRCSA